MFKCSECGYTSKTYFGLCPSCKEGMGEEIEGTVSVTRPKGGRASRATDIEIREYKIEKADGEVAPDKIIKTTRFKDFDRVVSHQGGFVQDQVIALGAQPGVGKSTLCAQICDGDSIYISTEESANQVKSRFRRVNPDSGCSIVSETDLETIIHIIQTVPESFIVLDSLNGINNGAEGYVRQANNLSRLTSVIKQHNKCAVIINQVTKGGEITGMNTVLHTVDTVMYFDKSEMSDLIVLASSKNRFGALGSVAVFEHSNDGLIETSSNAQDEITDWTGVTVAKAKFGYKNIDIIIEALVAPSSMNYGLRRAYGLNQARVQQIIGVLSSNSKIDFSSSDVYVSISNGLRVEDSSIDLAVANSVLSSHYKVPSLFKERLTGTISLNGSVKNSEHIKHVKDLIQRYKDHAKRG